MHRIRVVAAVVLAAAMSCYAAAWVYYTHRDPTAFLGVVAEYDGWARRLLVHEVTPDSPASRAGVVAGDAIVEVNGTPLDSRAPFNAAVVQGTPGDRVRLSLDRKDQPERLFVEAALESSPSRSVAHTGPQRVALSPLLLYPIPAVLVALVVLTLRSDDRHAWLLALVFAGFGVGPTETVESVSPPSLAGFLLGYSVLFSGMAPAFFYALLADFPTRSPIDRRVPWLRWVLLVVGGAIFVPFAVWTLAAGTQWPALRALTRAGVGVVDWAAATYVFVAYGLGLASLLLNCRRSVESDARRKARLITWSFAVGLVPWLVLSIVAMILHRGLFDLPFWLWVPPALLMMLVPILFAYALVRHRVLDFSVLVRRSARYVLVQRGFFLLALALSLLVTGLFVAIISRVLPRLTDAALPVGIAAGAVFGLVLVSTAGAVASRVTRRIDRAFFRSAYDARVVLEELAQRSASVPSRQELVATLSAQLREALHPRQIACYLRDRSGALTRFPADAPGTVQVLDLPPPLLTKLETDGQPATTEPGTQPSHALATLDAECLVPMLSRRRELLGLLVLGPRLSDEPYSREDRKLLASVASQAGSALENLGLAEAMAERLEAERHAAQEVEIAAQVQRRLLPVRTTELATVEYIGRCVQARAVGGDYYDFLDLGPGQLGLVLADVSGKGLYAALLMAHLQASVRSLTARLASEDLTTLLAGLNRTFGESTAGNHFATLFFGHYDDARRRMRYVNCGHQPPVLVKANGSVERLSVTAGAVGLFDDWSCTLDETVLEPGDVLALYSDGLTEAMNSAGDEFGEDRLVRALSPRRTDPLEALVEHVVGAVRGFDGAEQGDDMTLVIVRAR